MLYAISGYPTIEIKERYPQTVLNETALNGVLLYKGNFKEIAKLKN